MPAYAFQFPLPDAHRGEFQRLDLAHTRQLVIPCEQECGVQYSLIYPEAASEELLNRYRHEVQANMRACGNHVGKMFLNF